MAQTRVADELGIKRQTVNEVVTKRLIKLGLIEPINPKGNPRFYRGTFTTPVVSDDSTPVVSGSQRVLSKKPTMVKDNHSGKIKHWRRQKLDLAKRDFNTVVSIAGKHTRLCRVHGIGYTCTILHPPAKKVPWKPVKKGMKGLNQFDLKQDIPGLGKVTFRRQTSKNTDELIIWMPEKYFFEWELDEGEKLLEEGVWKARKWFQNHYKAYLSLATTYRRPKYAFEIFDPMMKRFVHEKGTIDAVTTGGIAEADESKKPYPEVEFPSIKQARTFVTMPDKVNTLEKSLHLLIDQVKSMSKTQERFTVQVQEALGFKEKITKLKEKENRDMYS